MSSLPYINISPIASPQESFLTVIGILIFLIVILCLLYLLARDEIWDKQHSI